MSNFTITDDSLISECITSGNDVYAWKVDERTPEIGAHEPKLLFVDGTHFLSKNITPVGLTEAGIDSDDRMVAIVTKDLEGYDIIRDAITASEQPMPLKLIVLSLFGIDDYKDIIRWLTDNPNLFKQSPKAPVQSNSELMEKPFIDGAEKEARMKAELLEELKNAK